MHPLSTEYLQIRPRTIGVSSILNSLGGALDAAVPKPLLREAMRNAGSVLAHRYPLDPCQNLADVEREANRILRPMDWGWLHIEAHSDEVRFEHGCSPLRIWFGSEALDWSVGLFEGLFGEWLRRLDADPQLAFRHTGDIHGPDDIFHFRLAHRSRFESE